MSTSLPSDVANTQWNRYAWARDNGHSDFIEKADKCDRFFRGGDGQWERQDLIRLRQERRPALTINKIMSTISNVLGEQIYNRSEINYRPRSGASSTTADVLTKVFKQISDNNQLDWLRSDMFADGIITSRGFIDIRMAFNDSLVGEVRYTKLNPKNVIVDPDADDYDPDTWKEVFVTKWMTSDDIATLYNPKIAEKLKGRDDPGTVGYDYDRIDQFRDRFASSDQVLPAYGHEFAGSRRNIRVIERQYRKLDRQRHFVSVDGDMRPIPKEFDANRIAWFVEKFGFHVVPKLVERIRWCVTAGNEVLHDEWSPYKHFTVVPFFPHFRHGRTIGLVENLIGPQELLNKTTSQELHIVNTTANSGYKVKAGALVNMDIAELEQRGAESGLVIEVNGDPDKDIVKIQPNSVPTGLDRLSYKAEESIKTISGVSDSAQGFDREDVAAKAIQAKRQAGATNLVKPLDNLVRTDFMIARNTLDLVQAFYTEQRLMSITHSGAAQREETFTVNEVSPEGEVINDITLGEFGVVVSSVPQRETLEDSQFEQATALKELGVQIPDETLIESSRLIDKKKVIDAIAAKTSSPEAQAQAALAQRAQEAEVAKTEAETRAKDADTQLKTAKAGKEQVLTEKEAITPPDDGSAEAMKAEAELSIEERRFQLEVELAEKKAELERWKVEQELALKREDLARKREEQRAMRAQQAAQATVNPAAAQSTPTTA